MEILKNKKEATQVVKRNFSILFIILFTICAKGQEIHPTKNNGGYIMEKYRNKEGHVNDSINFSGKVLNVKSKEIIPFAKIQLLCRKIEVDSLGNFKFTIAKSEFDRNYLSTSAIGFKTVETDYFQISKNQNILINFYLSEDDRPLVNCEGN